jgi:hypothetical protein
MVEIARQAQTHPVIPVNKENVKQLPMINKLGTIYSRPQNVFEDV